MQQSVFIGGPLDGIYMMEPPIYGIPGMFAAFEPLVGRWNRYVRHNSGGVLDIVAVKFSRQCEVRLDPFSDAEVVEYLWDGEMSESEIPAMKKRRKSD